MVSRHTHLGLAQLRSLPLDAKVILTQQRIEQWYEHWDGEVYVAFSGGKDSTVLLHLVRELYPEVPAVFSDTGLEFPEIKAFVRSTPNVTWVKPKLSYRQVVEKYGYPMPTKRVATQVRKIRKNPNGATANYHLTGYTRAGKFSKMAILPKKWRPLLTAPFAVSEQCCNALKKEPAARYVRETGRYAMTGEMAGDSRNRLNTWLAHGCNTYEGKRKVSRPLAFWSTENVWEYIRSRDVPYSSIYDMGYERTGCVWCMFGCHMEKGENRFQKLKHTHPKLWRYCVEKMGLREPLEWMGVSPDPVEEDQLDFFTRPPKPG